MALKATTKLLKHTSLSALAAEDKGAARRLAANQIRGLRARVGNKIARKKLIFSRIANKERYAAKVRNGNPARNAKPY